MLTPQHFPAFLRTPDAFSSHLEEQFADLGNTDRGDAFLEFALRLMPLCDFWAGVSKPKKSIKKSHDKGVDFDAASEDGNFRFYGQSKYRIREVADFDQIISKFRNYEAITGGNQLTLVDAIGPNSKPLSKFVLVTSSSLEGIISRYEQSSLPSKSSYHQYRAANRLQIVDGPHLLNILQDLYRRTYLLAPQVKIDLATSFLKIEDCYISVVSGRTLRALYAEHGNSLFFENIREFLGTSAGSPGKREGVNDEIAETLKTSPQKMLGRNNGVTMKAELVEHDGDRRLALTGCSIVNGCQTTMSIVEAGESADSANVLIKIVESADSWDVAKAANYQNSVSRIELDLARFLRPQLVTKMATDIGYGAKANEQTVSGVLEAVRTQKVSYDSMKLLYLGIFSRFPNNLFESNYSELRLDVLSRFYQDGKAEYLMRVLFQLLQGMDRASFSLQKRFEDDEHAAIFARFFQEDKPQYRCLLTILAACGCTDETIVNKSPNTSEAYVLVERFVRKVEVVLTAHPDFFDRVFMRSFLALAGRIMDSGTDGTPAELAQKMYREVNSYAGSKFPNLLGKLRLEMKSDDILMASHPDFSGVS